MWKNRLKIRARKAGRLIGLAALGLLLAALASAAEYRGVVNFGGLPLPGASLTATKGETKLSAVTGEEGDFVFPDLENGTWNIEITMLCFAPLKDSVIIAGAIPPAVFEMKLLPIDEIKAAAVAAPPPPPPALTTTAAVTPAATAKPGAKPKKGAAPPAPTNTPGGFQRANVNASAGAAPQTTEAAAAPPPPTDLNQSATDSFNITGSQNNGAASAFAQNQAFGNARRGRGSLYNGALSLNLDNAAFDARPYSLTGQDTARPVYTHLTGGVSFGGPLRIPHLYHPNTAPHFFIAYQAVRNTNNNTLTGLVPTQDQRNGLVPSTALDPTTSAPFPNNVIPMSRISPQALALLSYYPLPNFTGNSRYNYQIPINGAQNSDGIQGRISRSIGRFNQAFGTFGWQRGSNVNPNLFGFIDNSRNQGFTISASLMHRFNQRIFTTVNYNFSRSTSTLTPFFANTKNVSSQAGITGNDQEPLDWGPPSLNFSSGIYPLSDNVESLSRNETNSIGVSTFWSHAPHNITWGGDYRRLQFNPVSQSNPRGGFTFNGAATGSDFAGFLLGVPDISSIAFGNADKYFRSSTYDGFISDDWRVNPVVSVKAGVRWDYSSPITELYGRLVNLDIAPGYSAVAPVVANNPVGALTGIHYPSSLLQPDKHGFAPQIGVAWRPISGSSLIVRFGYALAYDSSVYQRIASQMAQQSPLSKSLLVANSAANPLTLANGFNATPGVTTNTFAVDPNFHIGYVQTWNASVQKDLPGSLVMTASYLGIKGTRSAQTFLPNTYPAGVQNPCPSCPSGYNYLTSNGNSTRESGQLDIRRRLHNGITASASYVYAHAIDDAALGGGAGSGSVIAQNWLDLSAERGRSNFDQRHLLSLQAQYSTGVGVSGGTLLSGWRGQLFKEWTIATQTKVGSGLPLTPVLVNSTGLTGFTTTRPDYTGISLYDAPPGFFLNPSAVVAPALGHWGNAGRNSIEGPDQFSLNTSLARTFRVKDRYTLDLRIDSTNTLNHVVFPNWNTTVGSTQFGLPSNALGMRNVHLDLRVRF